MDRRALLRGLLTVALLDLAARRGAAAPAVDEALARFDASVRDLRRGALDAAAWHEGVARLAPELDARALAKLIDLEKLKARLPLPSSRFASRKIRLPPSPRLRRAGFDAFLFGMKPGTAIPPHGHENVAALLLVLEGEVRARHYHRVSTAADHLILAPTIDRALSPGGATWVSDARDNVHWFQATQTTFALDLAVPEVRKAPRAPGAPRRQRLIFVDVDAAVPSEAGLKAPVLSQAAALRKYGRAG